jgi:hypothetical protein
MACLVLLVVRAHALEDPLGQIMGALAQRQHAHARVTERKDIALLDRPVESSGELFYSAPDRLEKRTLQPRRESLVLQGSTVTIQRGRRTRVVDLQRYPQILPLIESIRATLAGDLGALRRVFRVDFSGDAAHWQLVLEPLDPGKAAGVRRVRIEGEHTSLKRLVTNEADGDRAEMSIEEVAEP